MSSARWTSLCWESVRQKWPKLCSYSKPRLPLTSRLKIISSTLSHSFFDNLANYAGFMDRSLHTLPYLQTHSCLLLSVILYIASRHSPKEEVAEAETLAAVLENHIHANLWPKLFLSNYKSVHICQALMLWATFLPEPRPGEDDLGWTLFGHASGSSCSAATRSLASLTSQISILVRVAIDVGLNCKYSEVVDSEEANLVLAARNHERTWITCYIADQRWVF
jgi:hypothetical protein